MTPPSRDEARERLEKDLADDEREYPGRSFVLVFRDDVRALLSPEQGWRDAVKVVSDLLEVWPKDSLPPHELCLRAAAVVNGTPAPPTEVGGSELLYLCQGLADDYMTSETHHPGYVLIPTAKFEAIHALLADQPHPTATPKSVVGEQGALLWGWRPIETAPKDGLEMIGHRPDQGVFVFRWAWAEEFVPKDQNGDPTEDYDEDFGWWWHDRWGWMEGDETPTHWRPLPAPPTKGGE